MEAIPGPTQEPSHGIAVRCRGVVKSYGEGDIKVTALRGVDLEVRQGELLMIVGPSGCGKTTLISVIGAILGQDYGECAVLGRAHFRGASIGFVFQLFNLVPTLTAAENVAIPLLINGLSRQRSQARAREILNAVGLGTRIEALPMQLSGGEQQRVAIARALVHAPKLVICDEPTSNLDHQTGVSIMEVLRDTGKTRDRALIVVTHDPRIVQFADRIAHMDDGKIIGVTDGGQTGLLQ